MTLAYSHCVFSCIVWCDVSWAAFIINGILVYSCACWAWGGSDHASVWLEWALAHWCASTCLDRECAGMAAVCIHECPYLSNREGCGEGKVLVMCGCESVGYMWFTSGTHTQLTHTTTDPTVTAALTHTCSAYTHNHTQYTNTLPVAKTLIQVIFKNKIPLKYQVSIFVSHIRNQWQKQNYK